MKAKLSDYSVKKVVPKQGSRKGKVSYCLFYNGRAIAIFPSKEKAAFAKKRRHHIRAYGIKSANQKFPLKK